MGKLNEFISKQKSFLNFAMNLFIQQFLGMLFIIFLILGIPIILVMIIMPYIISLIN